MGERFKFESGPSQRDLLVEEYRKLRKEGDRPFGGAMLKEALDVAKQAGFNSPKEMMEARQKRVGELSKILGEDATKVDREIQEEADAAKKKSVFTFIPKKEGK